MTGFLVMAIAGLASLAFNLLLLYLLQQSNRQRDSYYYKLKEERENCYKLELKLRSKC